MTPPPSAASAAAPPLAPRRRTTAPTRPRRVSGPVRPARAPQRTAPAKQRAPRKESDGLVIGVLGALESLSSAPMLDKLIRGRLWIGIVAFALIGIVTLQLGLLRLNSSIGRALESESKLQRSNAALSIENSELAGGERVESQAEHLGMRLVGISGLKFHDSHARSDVPHAVAALKAQPKPAEAPVPTETTSSSAAGATESETSGGSETSTETAPTEEASSAGTESQTGGGEAQTAPAASETATSETSSTAGGGGTAAPGG